MFASVEKGASPRLSLGTGIWCCLGEFDQPGAAGQIPFAPRRDHLDVGGERVIAELEADLVVALAGRAVADGIGADHAWRSRSGAWRSAAARSRCRADTAPRTARWRASSGRHSRATNSSRRSSMKICSGLTPASSALRARRLQLLALAEIGGEGDDLAIIGLLQPFQDHAGVEPARIGEDDAVDLDRTWSGSGGWRKRRAL